MLTLPNSDTPIVLEILIRRGILFFLFSILALHLSAQATQTGQVIAPTGESLPFVNIIFNGDIRQGTTTDIDGRFKLPTDQPIQVLRFSYIGYRDLEVQLDTADTKPPWQIILQPQAYDFAAVEVVAGVNPADIIMRKVIQNRRRNDPEQLDRYRCRTYNKVVLSWLPQGESLDLLTEKDRSEDTLQLNKRQQRMLQLIEGTTEHHLFLMESLTERSFRHPAAYAETVLANKVSGLNRAPFAALANDVQPFSFYQEEVMLLDKPFLNPVSPGSPERYFFHLEDTLFRQQDTVYLLTFHPRKQKNFNGLKGVLYINTHRYAVQNIIAEPADTGLVHFRIEQLYERPDGEHWFPAQLNYEIRMPKYPDPQLGLKLSGKGYIREVELNTPLKAAPFRRPDRYIFADSAHLLPAEAWKKQRPEPLDSLETQTYILVDSLGEAHHFDLWMDRLEALGRGRWPLGVVELSLPKLLQLNQFENIRLGLGLYTGERLASWFSLGGYAGYGLKDERWKYGAEVEFFPDWRKNWVWRWYYQNDLSEAGGQLFPLAPGLVSRRLYAQKMDREERYGTFFQARPLRFLQIGLEASQSRLTPLYEYAFREKTKEEQRAEFRFFEAAVHLHYAYGQQYRRILGELVPDGQERPYPAFSLSIKKGFGRALGGDFTYWQAWMAIDQSFRLIRLGKTDLRLEGGKTWGSIPLSRLYNSPGFGRDFQWLTIGNIFQTMDAYEFLSDRYFSFFFRQEFGTLLFKTKWLKPSISLEHHFTIGNLSSPGQHKGVDFNTLERGYAEAGLIIDNLLRINYLNFAYLGLGAGVYYRYGAYHLPGGVGENLAFRLSMALDF